MVKGLVEMVHNLDIVPLAEGVETREEAEVSADLGFQLAQGFFFGHPSLPGFPEGCIFTREKNHHDVVAGNFPEFGSLAGKDLDGGPFSTQISIIQISLDDRIRGQLEGDIAPIIEGLLDGLQQLLPRGGTKCSALR